MTKYGLSSQRLQKLIEVLVNKNSEIHEELYKKSPVYRQATDCLALRRSNRLRIPIALRIYDKSSSQRGFLRDISENGIRVAGINVLLGQSRTLLLPLEELLGWKPLEFVAVCRWTKMRGIRKKYVVSGFEITEINENSRTKFLELIELLRFQGEGQGEEQDWALSTRTLGTELLASVGDMKRWGGASGFSGQIHGVDILDFIQFLLLTAANTVVHVESSRGESGRLFLARGKVMHAVQGNLVGREAFMACMNFPGGKFSTGALDEPPPQTIEEPGDFLLFNAARMRDELFSVTTSSPKGD